MTTVKTLYLYNDAGELVRQYDKSIADDYKLQTGESLSAPIVIYSFDEGKQFKSTVLVSPEHQLTANETNVVVPAGIKTPAKFDGTQWVNATDDEFSAAHPVTPSSADQAVAALTLQLAQNKADQDAANAQLLLATAKQTVKETN